MGECLKSTDEGLLWVVVVCTHDSPSMSSTRIPAGTTCLPLAHCGSHNQLTSIAPATCKGPGPLPGRLF